MRRRSGAGTGGVRLRWRAASLGGLLLMVAGTAVSQDAVSDASTQAAAAARSAKAWTLAWSDEFNSSADLQPWTAVTGVRSFGGAERPWHRQTAGKHHVNAGDVLQVARRHGCEQGCSEAR